MTVRAVAAGSGSVPSQAFHKMALANNSTCICNSKEMSRGGGKECRAILTTASETRDVSGESALEIAEEQAIDAEQVLHTGRSDIDGVHTDADSPAPQPLRQQSSEISEEPMNLEHARPVTPASRVQRQKKVGRVPIFAHSVWISKEIMVIADWWTILEGHDYRVKVGCRSVGAVTFQKPLRARSQCPQERQIHLQALREATRSFTLFTEDARDSLAKLLISTRPGLDLVPGKSFNTENLARA
ncbi:hypothetical protein PSHT_06636 [Puccinia striiformis]|uniref:Uncharacterized protein n=1 Tax=Puccinia striiformis TaxID=27350 RepID=A0A2S4W496_9BASI|nr:hypothetical protein PSHT_06636 [Puccinia striiformis]